MTSPPEFRRPYIDRTRGLAVLIMMLAHAMDAWTRGAERETLAFRNLTTLGGLAAPLFLWLAGLVLALAGERSAARRGSRRGGVQTIVHRGVEIFVLAFLFRLQAFLVSPGGPLVAIFRVDILNVMGPAIAAAGLLWGLAGGARRAAAMCGAMAAGIALVTPVLRSAAWVAALPVWFQWYLRPFGDLTTFTLFPWSGFVFAGAAAGSILSCAATPAGERRVLKGMAAVGAALVALGFVTASRPSIYVNSYFWTSSPAFFTIRVGAVMLVLALTFATTSGGGRWRAACATLEQFGRRSLFVYWVHVEMVYGYLTWPLHGNLPIWGVLAAYLLFIAVIYGILQLRERAVQTRPLRRGPRLDSQVLQT